MGNSMMTPPTTWSPELRSSPEQQEDHVQAMMGYVKKCQDNIILGLEKDLAKKEKTMLEQQIELERSNTMLLLGVVKLQCILVSKAILFASEKHKFQFNRWDGSAFIDQPLKIMEVLTMEGIFDVDVLCSAALNGVLQCTDTTETELREKFGDDITNIVLSLTDKTDSQELLIERQISNIDKSNVRIMLVVLAATINSLRTMSKPPRDATVEEGLHCHEGYKRACKQLLASVPDYSDTGFEDNVKSLKEKCLALCE